MYIGILKKKNTTYTHAGTEVPFPPSSVNEEAAIWVWRYTYDSAIDVNMELEKESFVGSVTVKLTENSLTKIEAIVDGKVCGYHTAETAKFTGGVITIPVGAKGNTLTLRLHTTLRDVAVSDIEILGAYDDERPLVWPTPKSIEYLGGFTKIKDVIAKTDDADEVFAAEFLKERLFETLGDWKAKRGVVIVFEKKSSKSYNGERYTVKTVRGKITVSAASRLTLLYGADTLLQLTDVKHGVHKFNCDDRPTKEFRGFHAGLPEKCQFEFMRRFFRYVLLPLRYNTVFVEIAGCMRYDSHPEIAEAWKRTISQYRKGLMPRPPHCDMLAMGEILEKEDVKRYIGYAEELGFEVIPEIQSLGHVQYITIAHPELAEIDDSQAVINDTRTEDARPEVVYPHCYCPSLEESYNLIFDLLDEVIELFKPKRFVHIGHDEVYQIGVCKHCRGKDPADIFSEHVTRLHDRIAKYGLRTMIWSDMIQQPPVRQYATSRSIDRLPRDVVMLDFVWYYKFDLDIEENILKYGYDVVLGNLYSSHFPRYESRVKRKGVIGGQISMWVENCERVYGNTGKMWDMMYTAEMLWNPEGYDARNRRTYSEIISKNIQPAMRDNIRGKYNPKDYKKTDVKLPKAAPAPAPLLKLCPKAITLNDETVHIGAKYERLVFEHATVYSAPRIVNTPFNVIGNYEVTYTDGDKVLIPIRYAETIMAYNTVYGDPMPQPYYRHYGYVGTWFTDPVYQGKDCYGGELTVTGFVWENPNPEKEIASVKYVPIENDYCGLILAGIKGLNKNVK